MANHCWHFVHIMELIQILHLPIYIDATGIQRWRECAAASCEMLWTCKHVLVVNYKYKCSEINIIHQFFIWFTDWISAAVFIQITMKLLGRCEWYYMYIDIHICSFNQYSLARLNCSLRCNGHPQFIPKLFFFSLPI